MWGSNHIRLVAIVLGVILSNAKDPVFPHSLLATLLAFPEAVVEKPGTAL